MNSGWARGIVIAGALIIVASIITVSVLVKQNWSQYVSDLTSGAVVGGFLAAVAAYVLWRWQKRSEETFAKRGAEQAWLVAREAVRADLDGPWDDAVSGSERWDRDWTQVERLFDSHLVETVPIWAAAWPESTELSLTRDLLRQASIVRREASALNFAIATAVATYQPDSAFQDNIIRAAWMILRGHEEQVDDVALVIKSANHVLGDGQLRKRSDSYLDRARDLRELYSNLWGLLEPASV